jgi:CBS domain-containing protein
MSATVADVMTRRVIALKRGAGYQEIVAVLRKYRVSACPVIDDAGKAIGMVSEADLLFKIADPNPPSGLIRLRWKLGEESKVTAVTAGRLMTSPAVTIGPGASVADAARLMQNRRVKRLPVVDQAGLVIGIISRADVLSVYERPDSDIREEVLDLIAGDFALDPDSFDVSVSSGFVTLTGEVDETGTALQLLARVRHADGVVGSSDLLTITEAGHRTSSPAGIASRVDDLVAKVY